MMKKFTRLLCLYAVSLRRKTSRDAEHLGPQLTEISGNTSVNENLAKETMSECSICLSEIVEDNEITKCSHKFHRNCLNNWAKTYAKSCPYCRSEDYRFEFTFDICMITIFDGSEGTDKYVIY